MSQVVLSSSKVATATWSDPRLLHIPAICAAASAAFLLLQLTFSTSTSKRLLAKLRARGVSEVLESDALLEPIASSHPTGYFFNLCSHIDKHSGGLILTWKILRLLSCVVLTTLSIVAIASSTTEAKHPESLHSPVDAKWLEVSLSIFYASHAAYLNFLLLTFLAGLHNAPRRFHLDAWPARTGDLQLPSNCSTSRCARHLYMA